MLVALSLGFAASWGHCVGMCSGIIALINSSRVLNDKKYGWVTIHAGRILSYGLLGLLAGYLGEITEFLFPNVKLFQGIAAIFAGMIGLYFSASIIGWVTSPEIFLAKQIKAWGKVFLKFAISRKQDDSTRTIPPFLLGMLWGVMPCGMVVTAIFTTIISTNPLEGLLRMFAFGLATLPALLGVQWVAQKKWILKMPRYLAALVMLIFSIQLYMRGLVSLDLVGHFRINGLMLW